MAAASAALTVVCEVIGGDHDHSRRRQAVITGNPELHERDLVKLASWSRLLADGLARRGVDATSATLIAETAVVVFRVAFAQWAEGPAAATRPDTVQESFAALAAVTGTLAASPP